MRDMHHEYNNCVGVSTDAQEGTIVMYVGKLFHCLCIHSRHRSPPCSQLPSAGNSYNLQWPVCTSYGRHPWWLHSHSDRVWCMQVFRYIVTWPLQCQLCCNYYHDLLSNEWGKYCPVLRYHTCTNFKLTSARFLLPWWASFTESPWLHRM